MSKVICGIYDVTVGSFGPLMCYDNFEVAKRAFRQFMDDAPASIKACASDLTLCMVGTFCLESGSMETFVSGGMFLGNAIKADVFDEKYMYCYLPNTGKVIGNEENEK